MTGQRNDGTGDEFRPFQDCTPECAVAVACPTCGSPLPPRGRSVPLEMNISTCCDEARRDPRINTRHVWSVDELEPSR